MDKKMPNCRHSLAFKWCPGPLSAQKALEHQASTVKVGVTCLIQSQTEGLTHANWKGRAKGRQRESSYRKQCLQLVLKVIYQGEMHEYIGLPPTTEGHRGESCIHSVLMFQVPHILDSARTF
jgi:hypothetical protein